MATEHHPIAIIGAGLGGLTAARVLQVSGIEAAVFELDASREARVQGGMLDVHEESGQRALLTAGLWDELVAMVQPGGEAIRILDRYGTVLREEQDEGTFSRAEVGRGRLRDLLLDSLPAGTVRWNSRVVRAQPLGEGRQAVELADGTSFTTDLLVGADGAWSRVRPLLSRSQPAYAGISFVEVDLFDADAQHPREAAVMGSGMLFALDGGTGILARRETDGSLHAYLGYRVDANWLGTADSPTVLDLLDGWDESLRGLIANADTPLTPRHINALPVGHSWERLPGVTLLGDAAHLMSPFAGEGANLAMYDGCSLGLAVAEHPDDIEAALTAYEAELFPRSTQAAVESARGLEVIFAADAPKGLLEMFE